MKNMFTFPKLKGFSESSNLIFSNSRTVCVLHIDGKVTEHTDITNPWTYIASLKYAPDVKSAWIKKIKN